MSGLLVELNAEEAKLFIEMRVRSFPSQGRAIFPYPDFDDCAAARQLAGRGFMVPNSEGRFQATDLGYNYPLEFVRLNA